MSTPYETLRAGYRWDCPERFNFARDVIDRWAESDPDQLALWWVDDHGNEEKHAFADIARSSRKLARVLSDNGVRRGERIVVILGRQVAWWETLAAGLRMGAVVSPGTTQLSARDLAYRLGACGATCVITDVANAPKFEQIEAECPGVRARFIVDGNRAGWIDYRAAIAAAPEEFEAADTAATDEALCFFTSGTTGYPKMCIHDQSYGLAHQTTGRYWLDLGHRDLHWNCSDTGWAKAAWSSFFGPWNQGAAVFAHHTQGFSAKRTLDLLEAFPVTTFCGAPTIYRMFVQEDLGARRFATLRHCVGAGEPLNPEVIETWRRATGITIRDGYGQTESVILCGNFPGLEPRFGSMGKPSPGIDLAVIDEDGHILSSGKEGDVAVRVKPQRPRTLPRIQGQPGENRRLFPG